MQSLTCTTDESFASLFAINHVSLVQLGNLGRHSTHVHLAEGALGFALSANNRQNQVLE